MKKSALSNLISELMPNTDSRAIMSALETELQRLEETTLQVTAAGYEVGKDYNLYDMMAKQMRKSRDLKDGGLVIGTLHKITKARVADKSDLVKIFKGRFKNDILKRGLSYDRAHLLLILHSLHFYNTYTRKFVLSLVAMSQEESVSPVTKQYSAFCSNKDNLQAFVSICTVFSTPWSEIGNRLSKLKDISFSEDTDATLQAVNKQLDPLKMGMVPVIGNILNAIIDTVYAWRTEVYVQDKADLERYQLHMEGLRAQKNGASKEEIAELDKAIDTYNDRCHQLESRMRRLENDLQIERKDEL